MNDLAQFDSRGILGVLTDIDETLTTHGQLRADAYAALWDLHHAGLRIVPVTGRSTGWAHMIMKTWPVDAVVAESGGVYLMRDPATGRMQMRFHSTEAQVAADRVKLRTCSARVMKAVPGLRPASDNPYRFVDLALDYCEEVPRVPPADVDRAVAMFVAEGFSARTSSVHINAWAGDFDKAPTTRRCLREAFAGSDLAQPDGWAFIGDAPNDASMFSAFRHTVGVANIVAVQDKLPRKPAYVTQGFSGDGFVEFCRHLLAQREARDPADTQNP